MAQHGSQAGGTPSPNGGSASSDAGSGARTSHLVPAPDGSSHSGAASAGAGSNGHANGSENGGVLSVDDPRTRALLEQLLQTISSDGGGGSYREKPKPSVVSEMWAALRRRWKPMLVVFAIALAGISWKMRPVGSEFVATATMQLPKGATSSGPDLSILSGKQDSAGSSLDTQIAILESRRFVSWVKSTTAKQIKSQSSNGQAALPDGTRVPAESVTNAIGGATFKATAPLSPELVNVTVTSDNPLASIALANNSVEIYALRLTQKGSASQDVDKDFVRKRLGEAEDKLNQAKDALQKYKEKAGVFDIQDALTRNTAAVETLTQSERAARLEADAGAQASSISGDAGAQSLQQRASEAQLQYDAVTRDFFPSSPEGQEAQAKRDAAQNLYLARVQRLIAQNQQAARVARSNLIEAKRRAATLPNDEKNLSRLQEAVAQRSTVYGQLSTRYTQLALSGQAKPATSEVVETALKAQEVSRTWSRAIMTGMLCALVMAGICAFLLEQLDHSLHSVTDLEPLLPASVLGTMPLLRGRSERRLAAMTGSQPMAPRVLEACRIVRSNLSFATMDSPAQTILITSAAPGEGKSLSALNLATVTAFDGRRVLLLDCDLRRPSQHSLNGLALEPGITNLLAGEASLEEVLQSTRVNNLSVMTAGTLPLNPPELLGSPDTRRFLQDLKERFDVIVIDSPPVLALTDAQVLCSQVDGVVMIVAAESTSKEEVQRAQAMLRHAGGRLLGAVFNKVRRADAAPGYGTYASYGPNMLGRDRALSESVGTLSKS